MQQSLNSQSSQISLEQKKNLGVYNESCPSLNPQTKQEITNIINNYMNEKTNNILNLAFEESMKIIEPHFFKTNYEITELKKNVSNLYNELKLYDLSKLILQVNKIIKQNKDIKPLMVHTKKNYLDYISIKENQSKLPKMNNDSYNNTFNKIINDNNSLIEAISNQKAEQKGNYIQNEKNIRSKISHLQNQIYETKGIFQCDSNFNFINCSSNNSNPNINFQELSLKTISSLAKIKADFINNKKKMEEIKQTNGRFNLNFISLD